MRIEINGEPRELDGDPSLDELLDRLELNSRQVAVEVNLHLIPRDQHASHRLSEGDELEIVTLTGGG